MMSLQMAIQAATNTPSGTQEYYAAEAICALRGVNPWASNQNPPAGFPSIPAWQAVIVESLLQQSLRDAMLAPRG